MIKRKRKLRDDLIKMACETEVIHTWNYARGCPAVCPCCGARCQNHKDCEGHDIEDGNYDLVAIQEDHQSKYHRPWGFAYKNAVDDDDTR